MHNKNGIFGPLLMWEKILRAIYAVSKQLQSKSTNLSASISLLGENVALISTLKNDFDLICQSAEDMAKKWGVEASFKETRTRTGRNFLMNSRMMLAWIALVADSEYMSFFVWWTPAWRN